MTALPTPVRCSHALPSMALAVGAEAVLHAVVVAPGHVAGDRVAADDPVDDEGVLHPEQDDVTDAIRLGALGDDQVAGPVCRLHARTADQRVTGRPAERRRSQDEEPAQDEAGRDEQRRDAERPPSKQDVA